MYNNSSFEEVLNRDGRLAYTNVGFSMSPLIREGRDVLLIEKRDIAEIKRYDAVLFRRENIKGRGEYVLHRILKILPDGSYYIVGDSCTNGEIVKQSQILGVLTGINRSGKSVNMNGIVYKMYVAFWCAPYGLRFAVLKARRFLRRVFHRVIRRLKIRR